jgi:hypothetical protein
MARRRWFRFSLRTLLVVVTLLAIPLGWYTSKRKRLDGRDRVFGEMVDDRPLLRPVDWFHGAYLCPPPPGLSLWGEHGYTDLWVHGDRYDAEFDRLQKLFPEAKLHRDGGDER